MRLEWGDNDCDTVGSFTELGIYTIDAIHTSKWGLVYRSALNGVLICRSNGFNTEARAKVSCDRHYSAKVACMALADSYIKLAPYETVVKRSELRQISNAMYNSHDSAPIDSESWKYLGVPLQIIACMLGE